MANLFSKIYNWLRSDGVLHLGISALLVIFFGAFAPIGWVCLGVFFIGLFKEFYDSLHPEAHEASWHDLFCDLIGISIGACLSALYLIF